MNNIGKNNKIMNKYIDHTVLKQTTTKDDIVRLCEQAYQYAFAAVCVPPNYTKLAKLILSPINERNKISHNQMWLKDIFPHTFGENTVRICTVIGFPFGYSTTKSKVAEINQALEDGADEVDIVQNVTSVKNCEWKLINNEIYECLKAIGKKSKNITVKIILESGILTDEEIINCCKIYGEYNERLGDLAHISFIKTSTGYAEQGASVHHIELIKANIPEGMYIKASGGIRDYVFAKQLIDAGATRIGCSAGVKIIEESKGIFTEETETSKY